MTTTPDNPLEFITNEQIIDELGRRFEVVLFAGWTSLTDAHDKTPVWWKGGAAPALGLLEYAKVKLQRNISDQLDYEDMQMWESEDEDLDD